MHQAKKMATPEETFSASSMSSPSNNFLALSLLSISRSVGLKRPIRCLTLNEYFIFNVIKIYWNRPFFDIFLSHGQVFQVKLAFLARSRTIRFYNYQIEYVTYYMSHIICHIWYATYYMCLTLKDFVDSPKSRNVASITRLTIVGGRSYDRISDITG